MGILSTLDGNELSALQHGVVMKNSLSRTSGVFPGTGNEVQPQLDPIINNQINILDGFLTVDGRLVQVDGTESLVLDSDGTYNIVYEVNLATGTAQPLALDSGTTLIQDDLTENLGGTHQFKLAEVLVTGGEITSSTDSRVYHTQSYTDVFVKKTGDLVSGWLEFTNNNGIRSNIDNNVAVNLNEDRVFITAGNPELGLVIREDRITTGLRIEFGPNELDTIGEPKFVERSGDVGFGESLNFTSDLGSSHPFIKGYRTINITLDNGIVLAYPIGNAVSFMYIGQNYHIASQDGNDNYIISLTLRWQNGIVTYEAGGFQYVPSSGDIQTIQRPGITLIRLLKA